MNTIGFRALAPGLMALAAGGLWATSARATGITLYNTGVNNANAVLADGIAGDPHYTLVSVPGGSANLLVRTSAGGFPVQPFGPWFGDDGTSAWIGPNNSPTLTGVAGTYDYQTTFTLPAAGTVSIAGQWLAATAGAQILLNGTDAGAPAAGYTGFTAFSINDAPALDGVNTLDFLVTTQGVPTGLRVEFTSATANLAVPEPASLAILGLGALGLLARRRRV